MNNTIRGVCWCFTLTCNMRCPICYAYKNGNQNTELYFKKNIIDALYKLGLPSITFSGGEPLTDKDLINCIAYAKDKGLYTILATNGSLLSKETLKKLNPILDELTLPIDGSNYHIHCLNRGIEGKNQYYKVMKLLDQVIYYDFKTAVGTVMTKYNVNDIRAIGSLLTRKKIKRWKLYRFYPLSRAFNYKKEFLIDDYMVQKIQKQVGDILNDIDTIIANNNKKSMRSYSLLLPSGDIIIADGHEYKKLESILNITNLNEFLAANKFNFIEHNRRKYKDQ